MDKLARCKTEAVSVEARMEVWSEMLGDFVELLPDKYYFVRAGLKSIKKGMENTKKDMINLQKVL